MYAHFALQRLHFRPREFESMPLREKAFVIASIDEYVEAAKGKGG